MADSDEHPEQGYDTGANPLPIDVQPARDELNALTNRWLVGEIPLADYVERAEPIARLVAHYGKLGDAWDLSGILLNKGHVLYNSDPVASNAAAIEALLILGRNILQGDRGAAPYYWPLRAVMDEATCQRVDALLAEGCGSPALQPRPEILEIATARVALLAAAQAAQMASTLQ